MTTLYVQFGCGFIAPKEWVNFDNSPTLRIQKLPIVGPVLRHVMKVVFPENVRYGDITKGLPVADNSCDGVYCSNVLEHLSLGDFRRALRNTFRILKRGGIFRCLVPDLEQIAGEYIKSLNAGNELASIDFVGKNTLLGLEERPRNLGGYLRSFMGNSRHLWMWDTKSMSKELRDAGFGQIRVCRFGDCDHQMFGYVENSRAFDGAVAIECRKI